MTMRVTEAMVEAFQNKYREIAERCHWGHSWPAKEPAKELLEASLASRIETEGEEPVAWVRQSAIDKLNADDKLDSFEGVQTLLSAEKSKYCTVPLYTKPELCSDCPPVGYPTDKTRCLPCPRRAPQVEPVAYASAGQLTFEDKPDNELGGTYIPLRKSPAGLFKTPLFASPRPTVSEAMVEAAAKAMHDGPLGADDEAEYTSDKSNKAAEWCREMARAALTAALSSVPGKGDNTLETALADFSKKLIASQTEIEPEFAEALYGNRAESYRTFEPGTIRICPMRDGPCPHGLSCQFVGDGYSGYPCKEGWNVRAASPKPSDPSSPEDGR